MTIRVIRPSKHTDKRGYFSEIYNRKRYTEIGIPDEFVQDNHSLSNAIYTIRGLHLQKPPSAQGKLVRCGRGKIFDVAVDIRVGSPTYGKWEGYMLTPENGLQIYVPIGFAHGFVSLEPYSEIVYKCTNYYDPEAEAIIRWDSCGIDWPLTNEPILNDKDINAPKLQDFESPFIFGVNS